MKASQPSSAEAAQQIKSLLKGIHEERADAARLDELRRLFGQLVKSGDLTFSDKEKEATITSATTKASQKWQAFLEKQHQKMVSQLMVRIVQNKKTAVRTMWGVIAASPKQATNKALTTVHPDLIYQWLKAMMGMEEEIDKSLRHMIEQEFLHPYLDVQYYALVSIARLATDGYNSLDNEEAERLLQLLMMVPIPTGQKDIDAGNYLFPTPKGNYTDASGNSSDDDSDSDVDADSNNDDDSSDEDESDEEKDDEEESNASKKRKRRQPSKSNRTFAFQQVKHHHRALSNAWLAVLKLEIPTNALNHALRFLPKNVLSRVHQPLRFSDFFVRAYSPGSNGITSLLALDGLFYLMTEHGLEHPRFYESLYTLVQPQALGAKHRGRFLELLTKCLCRNEMLPAHIVASFVKRLLRAALNAPPPGALFVLAISANLLRQHAECACLIHRNGDKDDNGIEDVFDAHTNDPTKTRALESSLWELSALSQHYYPAVATLAKSIGTEDDKTPLLDTDDFLRHTYKSLFDQERKRGEPSHKKKRQKKIATPLTFVEPKGLFDDDILGEILSIGGNI